METAELKTHDPLIEECRQGNSLAQFRLYNQYSKAMLNLAFRLTGNREDAEDILQESFVECFRNLDSFREESTFGAWLKKIVINRGINHVKKKKPDIQIMDTIPDKIEDEDDNEAVHDINEINRNIQLLPDGYRIVLTLYLLEGYDHSEIAQITGLTESTSKSQYSRAKEKLRSMLKRR
ncbi:MAG: RNA polymerase sigma factor [Bacteroidales bacterium]